MRLDAARTLRSFGCGGRTYRACGSGKPICGRLTARENTLDSFDRRQPLPPGPARSVQQR
jgi:hypothetical protein